MRHRRAGRKLGRTSAHRRALLRNLTSSLFLHEKIITTEAKAKELRRVAERMITLAKRQSLHARRLAATVVQDARALKKLFDRLGARYQERHGGYTRITKLGHRAGDGASMVAIELIGAEASGGPRAATGRRAARAGQGEPGKGASAPAAEGSAAR
jgi:large subunit ribosomal protein L17